MDHNPDKHNLCLHTYLTWAGTIDRNSDKHEFCLRTYLTCATVMPAMCKQLQQTEKRLEN